MHNAAEPRIRLESGWRKQQQKAIPTQPLDGHHRRQFKILQDTPYGVNGFSIMSNTYDPHTGLQMRVGEGLEVYHEPQSPPIYQHQGEQHLLRQTP